MQKGRKNRFSNVISLAATSDKPKLTASRPLNKAERDIFNLVVREHRHLRVLDQPLATAYAIACAAMLSSTKSADFERATRAAVSLGRSLRLTPLSVMRSDALGRKYADPGSDHSRKLWAR
jgi:hypothetical protein